MNDDSRHWPHSGEPHDRGLPGGGRARAEELLGAGAAGELTDSESAELAALLERNPDLRAELDELDGLAGTLRGLGGQDFPVRRWREDSPPAELRERVLGVTTVASPAPASGETPGHPLSHPAERSGLLRARGLLVAAALALVLAGGLGGAALRGMLDQPQHGPPGTLGALETVEFSVNVSGVEVEAAVMPHTWGTEAFLELDGLAPGETFDVVLVGRDGTAYHAGAFLGSEVPIVCQMNAAVLREDVEQIEVRDIDGTIILWSSLPEVG